MTILEDLELTACFKKRDKTEEIDYHEIRKIEQAILVKVQENEDIRSLSMNLAAKSNY